MASEQAKNEGNRDASRKPLTEQELDFVRFYMADPMRSATGAAKKAGYVAKNLGSTATRLLKKPHIAAAIAAAQAHVIERAEEKLALSLDRVLDEFALIAFGNMGDFMRITASGDPYLDLSSLTRDQAAIIQEATVEDFVVGRGKDARDVRKVKIKLYDKQKALMAIGQHLGGFVRAKAKDAVPVRDDAVQAFIDRVRAVERSTIPIAPQKFRTIEGGKE